MRTGALILATLPYRPSPLQLDGASRADALVPANTMRSELTASSIQSVRSRVLQTKNMEYSGCGSSWATMARPMAMMSGDDAVDALGGLVLGGLEVAGGVLGDGDIGGPFGPAALRDLHQNATLTP